VSAAAEVARRFDCFGASCEVRVSGPAANGTSAQVAAMVAQGQLLALHRRLSRFDRASELSQLNADPEAVVHASRLLRTLAHAVVEAGERSGGLVDATLVGALERAGYAASRAGLAGLSAGELVAHDRAARAGLGDSEPAATTAHARRLGESEAIAATARAPRPARPHPDRRWRQIVVDDVARTITRPPGVRIDSGGLGKGLAADLVAAKLAGHALFVVDCAGDVRIGGSASVARRVLVEDPFGGAPLHELRIAGGAVATSGVTRRSWRAAGGAVAHHLLDPATGEPAWTGVIQATALAATALEAETLAKSALLAGPQRGRELLASAGGGVLVFEDGSVAVVERERALRAA
jgi:thiamine biosynthesis lipoprotein